MKMQIYAIYDTAAGIYDRQIFAQTDGIVTREFKDLCNNAEHQYGQHPEDYSVFRLGNFDNLNGKLVDENNECLATGLEMVALARNINRDNNDSELMRQELNKGNHA